MNDPRFHAYPREDLLRARFRLRRLETLEAQAADRCAPFVGAHRVALALSFGKDSMTCLHLLHMAGLLDRCAIVMWNASGIETADTLALRDYVVERYAVGNYVETWPEPETLRRTLGLIDFGSRHPTRDFVYECLEQPRWRAMDEHEIDGTILGLRAQESRARRMHVATRGVEYWNRREKADILLPLARWTLDDVFAYAALRDVPLHPVYHKLPMLGVPREDVRLNTPVSVCQRTRGQLLYLRRLDPEAFRRYAEMVPAVRTYT